MAGGATGPAFVARALLWTAPDVAQQVLGEQPRQCLRPGFEPAKLATGEALFNSPALLGGQAAKAQLSCAACHRNGRDNVHFLLPQLSGAPGTADVTNSFFGTARANARFDPVIIPDLAAPGKVSRAPDNPELARFIRTLVVEEFSGAEPTPAMLDALASYVRAIGPCPAGASALQPRRLADQLRLIDQAVAGASAAIDRDAQTETQQIAAARHQLGLIDERYARADLGALRRALLGASRDLARLAASDRKVADRRQALQKWHRHFSAKLVPRLRRDEPASLYDPGQLRRALEGDRAAPD